MSAKSDYSNNMVTVTVDFDKRYNIVDIQTPRHTLLAGQYKQSFAYFTLRERLPVIITGIVDHLTRDKDTISNSNEECREEIKAVVGEISKLKYQLQTDKPFERFTDNEPDAITWNKFLRELPADGNSFFKACWLYSECYTYRKVFSIFSNSVNLKGFDYFQKQKMNALVVSVPVMEGISKVTRVLEKDEDTFCRLLKLNLWGNRCDLSISTGKEVKPSDDAFEAINSLNKNLLIDKSLKIWNCLPKVQTANTSVAFILDNAGYELFTDLILAEYIIDKQLAEKVVFYVKAIPWFISDTTTNDFEYTLGYLKRHSSEDLSDLGIKWTNYKNEGKFEIAPVEHFWTNAYEYYRMREIDSELYNKLSKHRLLIFKGDLNYRKLLGDFSWDNTEPFITCLRGFYPTNLCSLRTIKADLICGLPEGRAHQLNRLDANWMTSGDYGVIQFCERQTTATTPQQ